MPSTREKVALASRILAANGHDDLIWGHASCRDPDGRGAWLKSASWGLAEVTADRVHLVGGNGDVLEGTGPRHSEYPIHTEIYAARSDIGGVVHTHPPYSIGLAASGQRLRPLSHAAAIFVPPDVPLFTSTSDLILTAELGQEVAAVLGDTRAAFLLNHGIVTVGPTLEAATAAAVLLERACRQQALTAGLGGWATWTSAEEAVRKRRHMAGQQTISAVWDHLVRSLEETQHD